MNSNQAEFASQACFEGELGCSRADHIEFLFLLFAAHVDVVSN